MRDAQEVSDEKQILNSEEISIELSEETNGEDSIVLPATMSTGGTAGVTAENESQDGGESQNASVETEPTEVIENARSGKKNSRRNFLKLIVAMGFIFLTVLVSAPVFYPEASAYYIIPQASSKNGASIC